MNEKRELKFYTIDDWNRPVFKDKHGNLFGNMNILFDWGTSAEKVLEKIDETMIYYFGQNIDDDPMGTKIKADKIKLII
jgi:hypothetical protein